MKKRNYLVILLILVFIIFILFIQNIVKKEELNLCPTCPLITTDNYPQDLYSFLNHIDTENLLCVDNTKLHLLRCNNIIEEKYDDYENLIYIKTEYNEYFYTYVYDDLGRVKVFSFDNVIMKMFYDEYNRITKINYMDNDNVKKIIYTYKPLIEDTTGIPDKIEVYNNNKIEYVINYKKEFGEESIITEIKKDFIKNESSSIVYNPLLKKAEDKTFFELINYIPEPYYINNPFFNNDYLYSNHGLIFDNFKTRISDIKNIKTKINNIEYIYQEKYSYSTNKDYITILSDVISDDGYSHINKVAYKNDDKFYEYYVNQKKEKLNYYYEITNPIEIEKEDFYNLFEF